MSRFSFRACLLAGAVLPLVAFAAPAAQAATEALAYSFQWGNDANHPTAALIKVNGKLYGTSYYGGGSGCGGYGCGTVYSFDPATGTDTVVYTFQDNGSDGQIPEAALVKVGGILYGTTSQGGAYGQGTLFSVDPNTGTESVLYSFQSNGADGTDPGVGAVLIHVGSMLYGTTNTGGTNNKGTVFSFNVKTGAENVMHSFGNGSDGASPFAGLVDVNGAFFGTTSSGGASGYGTVYSLDRKTGAETVLYSFQGGSDGAGPVSLINVKGTFYGATFSGGAANVGTVFSLDPTTGAETVLYAFKTNGTDGYNPYGNLIDVKGTLYGTTYFGGHIGVGTVFSLDPKTDAYAILHSFEANGDGQYPFAGLTNFDGTLYGTAWAGGANDAGVVFTITP